MILLIYHSGLSLSLLQSVESSAKSFRIIKDGTDFYKYVNDRKNTKKAMFSVIGSKTEYVV